MRSRSKLARPNIWRFNILILLMVPSTRPELCSRVSQIQISLTQPSDVSTLRGEAQQRLAAVARTPPAFAAALRGYRRARLAGDTATAEALVAWLLAGPGLRT